MRVIVTIIFATIICISFSNGENKYTCLENNKLKYGFAMRSSLTMDSTYKPMQYFVVLNPDSIQLNIINQLSDSSLITLMLDSLYDYNANLILYYKHQKDAWRLKSFNIETWRSSKKEEDIKCWKSLINN